MTSALRLTTLLMWMPVAAYGLQVTPPTPPRPAVEPRVPMTPRPPATPLPPSWDHFAADPGFKFDKLDRLHDLADQQWELSAKHMDMSNLQFDMKGLEWASKMDMKFDKFEKFESSAPDLDMRLKDLSWGGEHFAYSPKAGTPFGREPFATSARSAWIQGDVADSLYKSAREMLNSGEWRRAATAFASIPQRYPNSGYAADSYYWQAFALYRIGGTEDLRSALRALETMRSKYSMARTQSDAAALTTRVRGTLASRGDPGAREAIQKAVSEGGEQACDREDQQVRGEALKALAQTDPASLVPSVKRVLAKKDACSAILRRTAVYLLGQSGDNEGLALLRDVALTDSEPEVRSAAIQYLARSPSDIAVNTLDEVLRTSTDQSVQRTAARALAQNPSARAKQSVRALIERTDASERLRVEAVGGFENSERTTDDDATWLRSIYPKVDNARVKGRIARVIGQLGGDANDQWLLGLMRNNDEPLEVRTAALERVASRNMSIAEAVKLYGTVADRQLRERLISVYRQRKEPEATDKLIDIVKNDTDYNLRRQAINALMQKDDPRAKRLMMEIIDK